MGGCLSCAFAEEDKYVPKGTLGARELDEMDVLTQGSLRRAFGLFSRADSDRNGKLDASELARVFNLEDDVYLGRLVEIIDCDGNGTIDFREFVVGLAAFVLSGSFGRVRFAFRLFDLNNDGTFSKRELLTAIRAAESRHEASRDAREKRSANYWGDRAVPDPLVRYKDLIGDLDARPDELGYEEFTRIVTRHPRVFAPVNQMWHALRQYADPAVKVVTQIRRSGNSRFFRGTVLEPGRAEQIFAPPGSATRTRRTRREDEDATAARRPKKKLGAGAADRDGDERGPRSDSSRLRRWLDDAASSVRQTAAVGLERVSSFGSPRRASRAKTRAPAWEADARARLARTPSEKSAEERLDEDFAKSRGRAFGASARGESGDEDEDAASDVTMQDIWEALRDAPNPVLPDAGDARFAATPAASGSVRLRLAAAAAAAPPPADYSSTLDVAARAKRRLAAQRGRDGRDGATRVEREAEARRERRAAGTDAGFRSRTERAAGAAARRTERDARFAIDASPPRRVPPNRSAYESRSDARAADAGRIRGNAPREKSANVEGVIAAHRAARRARASPQRRRRRRRRESCRWVPRARPAARRCGPAFGSGAPGAVRGAGNDVKQPMLLWI
mgnify:CR=1 FL=1